jgi:terpene synthase-like protein
MDTSAASQAIDVDIPPLFCPFPYAIHPEYQAMDQRCLTWLTQVGVSQVEQAKALLAVGNWAEGLACSYPVGAREAVQLVIDWAVFYAVVDDMFTELGPLGRDLARLAKHLSRMLRTLEVPNSGLTGDTPFERAWRDIAQRCFDLAPPQVFRRWVQGHRAHFACVAWHQSFLVAGRLPNLNEYISLRGGAVGTAPSAAMVELTRGCEVPSEEMDSPAARALHEAWAFLHGCDNDLISYGKELWDARHARTTAETSATPFNIVGLMMHERGCDLPEALAQTVTLRNQVMLLLLRLVERLRRRASAPMRTYLDGVGPNIRGVLDWYLCPRTTRYTNPDGKSPGAVRYAFDIIETAPAARQVPTDLPTMSWWWDHVG